MIAGVFMRISTARKTYRCDAGFLCLHSDGQTGNVIQPGQRYVTEKVAPWTLTSDDPESAPFPIGEWYTERWHADGCDPRYLL